MVLSLFHYDACYCDFRGVLEGCGYWFPEFWHFCLLVYLFVGRRVVYGMVWRFLGVGLFKCEKSFGVVAIWRVYL